MSNKDEGSWQVLGGGVVIGGGAFIGRVALDAWSMDGLTYALGLSDGRGLLWPTGSAVLFWVTVIEMGAAAGALANRLGGRTSSRWYVAWAWGHLTFGGWLYRLGCLPFVVLGSLVASARAGRSPSTLARAPWAVDDGFFDDENTS